MRRYQLRAAFLWAILALSGLGLLLAAFSLKSNLMPWAVVLFLVVCLAVQVLLYRSHRPADPAAGGPCFPAPGGYHSLPAPAAGGATGFHLGGAEPAGKAGPG